MRLLGFDPQEISTVLQRGDAVEYHPILSRALAELEQTGCQTRRLQQLAVGLNHHVTIGNVISAVDVIAIEEPVVEITQITRLLRYRNLLGKACAERVGARHDNAVFHAQLQEGVANRANLGDKVGVGDRHLAVLVSALLLVRDLVFNLDSAGARLNHASSQQVGGLLVAESGIDVSDNRHHVGLELINLLGNALHLNVVATLTGFVEGAEQATELTGVGLSQEGVKLFNQRRDRGFLVHRLIGQRTKL